MLVSCHANDSRFKGIDSKYSDGSSSVKTDLYFPKPFQS